jgi:P-type Cu+ transporter
VDTALKGSVACYHCGEDCTGNGIMKEDKSFCCEGCKMVYELLNKTGMCEYYELNQKPGTTQFNKRADRKFAFLDDKEIEQRLISFKDDVNTHVTFYIPQIHCSSCLWLLENLPKIQDAVISSRVKFAEKEVTIIFSSPSITLRKIAELLTEIGYEPYISLNDLGKKLPEPRKSTIYQLGVAGFCFGNIMLLSFPEYLGLEMMEKQLQGLFRILSLILSLPVFFYSALPFYTSAYKSLRKKHLNIDAPIALAIIVTFGRSVFEILTDSGSGYLDSMSGIVFFMLLGRYVQDKTYLRLSFERDYRSYFPVAVSVLKENQEVPTALTELHYGDTILIHNEELIPADGILTKGRAYIDYSFVTGESVPVLKEMGEIIYAGGRQKGPAIELLVIKEVAQGYLTGLWNRQSPVKEKTREQTRYIQALSRYFSCLVFGIAFITGIYWQWQDPSKLWNAVTAILIVACPCALLLTSTFSDGSILRIFSRNRLYLRNARVIEDLATVDRIVFDKTGTLTTGVVQDAHYIGRAIPSQILQAVSLLARQSTHPLCKALLNHLPAQPDCKLQSYLEVTGGGIEGSVDGQVIRIGSSAFVTGNRQKNQDEETRVYIAVDNEVLGHYTFSNRYRKDVPLLLRKLNKIFKVSVVSGDNGKERSTLRRILGGEADLLFQQSPVEKLQYVERLQQSGAKVLMVGDGLNDAGALQQSHVGIAVTEHCNNFTPASDAILEAKELIKLPNFIKLSRINKRIIVFTFLLSTVYNIIGLSYAVTGDLSPIIAAILMPSSSLTIVLLTFSLSNLAAKKLNL